KGDPGQQTAVLLYILTLGGLFIGLVLMEIPQSRFYSPYGGVEPKQDAQQFDCENVPGVTLLYVNTFMLDDYILFTLAQSRRIAYYYVAKHREYHSGPIVDGEYLYVGRSHKRSCTPNKPHKPPTTIREP